MLWKLKQSHSRVSKFKQCKNRKMFLARWCIFHCLWNTASQMFISYKHFRDILKNHPQPVKLVPPAHRQIVKIYDPLHHQHQWFPPVLIASSNTCTAVTHQGSNAPLRSSCGPQGDDRPTRKGGSAHPHGENGKAGPGPGTSSKPLPNHSVSLHKAPGKRKQKKINIDEAEGKNWTTSLFCCFCGCVHTNPSACLQDCTNTQCFKASYM